MGLMDWLGCQLQSALNPEIESQFTYLRHFYSDGLEWWLHGGYRSPSHRGFGGHHLGESITSLDYWQKKDIVQYKDTIISLCEDERLFRKCEPYFQNHFYGICVVLVKYYNAIVTPDEGKIDDIMHDKISSYLNISYESYYRPIFASRLSFSSFMNYFEEQEKNYRYVKKSEILRFYLNEIGNHLDEVIIADKKIREMYRNEEIKEEFHSKILLDKIRSQYYQDFLKTKEKELTDKAYCIDHLDELDQFIHSILEQKRNELQKKYGYSAINVFVCINELGSSNSDLYTIIRNESEIAEISRKSSQEHDQMIENQRQVRIRRHIDKYNEAIRLERIKKREAKQRDIDTLNSCISSWDKHSIYGFPYFSMFYYYPTSVDAVTNKDWEIRNLIWGFKADPSRTTKISKSEADFDVRMYIEKIINHFFGNNKKLLTFVCIPASTKKTTELRYKEFSQDICCELNMNNAYGFIEVYQDKTPKHEGGESEQVLSIDSGFFKDKYVILFDDILTSGKSLAKMKERLESYGATVIGCITIGITKHQHSYSKQPIDTF